MYKTSQQFIDTCSSSKDGKWIFVLSTSKILYVGKVRKMPIFCLIDLLHIENITISKEIYKKIEPTSTEHRVPLNITIDLTQKG